MLSPEERRTNRLSARINRRDFEEFLDKYCEYLTDYKNSDVYQTHSYDIKYSRLEVEVKCFRDEPTYISEFIIMKRNDMWYDQCDYFLKMEHNLVNENDDWIWKWQIVDHSIGKRIDINKEDIYENIFQFMLEYSKGKLSVTMQREYKLNKLNI